MSPELSQEKKVESVRQLSEALREHYNSVEMQPGEVHEIPPVQDENDKSQFMAECGKDSLRTYQTLRAVITAGQEMFFVIDTMTLVHPSESTSKDLSKPKGPHFVRDTVLARRNPDGERADLVGFMNAGDRPLHIGRKYQHGLSPQTSGDHFSIAKVEDGGIGLVDNGSTNGTELFTPHQVTKGEKYGFTEELKQATAERSDPVQKHEFWSMDSATLKGYVEFIHNSNQKAGNDSESE